MVFYFLFYFILFFYFHCYSAQLSMAMHCSWELKKNNNNYNILRSHYLFIFYSFCISFSHVSLLIASPSLLSSSINPSFFLHRPIANLHKPSRHRPLSPHFSSLTSQPTSNRSIPFRFALIPFRSRRTKPHRWQWNRAVSIS